MNVFLMYEYDISDYYCLVIENLSLFVSFGNVVIIECGCYFFVFGLRSVQIWF